MVAVVVGEVVMVGVGDMGYGAEFFEMMFERRRVGDASEQQDLFDGLSRAVVEKR